MDATSEVEMRQRMMYFVIGVFEKPEASIIAISSRSAYVETTLVECVGPGTELG